MGGDQIVLKQQKERLQALMEDNHRLVATIATLKIELKEARREVDSLSKSVKMITSETQTLDGILTNRKPKCDKKGLSFLEKILLLQSLPLCSYEFLVG